MPPEYVVHGSFSVKTDVFSFGVIILEIVSGKKIRDFCDQHHHLNLFQYVSLMVTFVIIHICHIKLLNYLYTLSLSCSYLKNKLFHSGLRDMTPLIFIYKV